MLDKKYLRQVCFIKVKGSVQGICVTPDQAHLFVQDSHSVYRYYIGCSNYKYVDELKDCVQLIESSINDCSMYYVSK